MKIAYVSDADESTGFRYNVQIVDDGSYTKESFYENDLWDAFIHEQSLGCEQIYTTF